MFQHQHRTENHDHDHERRRHVRRAGALAVIGLTALAALGVGAGPATAQQDRGPAAPRVGHQDECFLQRVGTQYVRCDDNTGNGVPAPAWIPKR
jgi:hypothetical protein